MLTMTDVIDIGIMGTQHVEELDRNPILGAIVGDIVGSRYEFSNHKSKEFEFIDDDCFFTDDTVHTLAVYDAVRNSNDINDFKDKVKDCLVRYTCKYPDKTYGNKFIDWIINGAKEPYGSYGNGSAMRVSGVPYVIGRTQEAKEVVLYSVMSSMCTHNHPEGIKGAMSVAGLIYEALKDKFQGDKRYLKLMASLDYPKIQSMTVDNLRETYKYNETCQDTVPQAIVCFLESTDFEDAIRNAISIGGDSDTLAAITGSIAAAYYGVPNDIKMKALSKLDDYLLGIYKTSEEI